MSRHEEFHKFEAHLANYSQSAHQYRSIRSVPGGVLLKKNDKRAPNVSGQEEAREYEESGGFQEHYKALKLNVNSHFLPRAKYHPN